MFYTFTQVSGAADVVGLAREIGKENNSSVISAHLSATRI